MDSSGSVELDQSQPPSPSSLPPISGPRSSRNLFFSGPEEEAEPAESLHLVTEAAGAGGSVSEEWESDGFADPSDVDQTSSRESSDAERPAQLLSKKQYRDTAETAVKIGTGMAHTVAAKTEAQQAVGLYLADDEDAKAIGHPLADIMYRRGDLVGGKLSPDANDFLRSLMGVAGYFTKQVAKIGVVRQLEAGQVAEPQTIPTEGVA